MGAIHLKKRLTNPSTRTLRYEAAQRRLCQTLVAMNLSAPIPLQFNAASVRTVLSWGATPESAPYSHKQIAEWCDRFWCSYLESDAPEDIEPLLPILTDVETQWDLFLANSFSIEQLQTQSFEHVKMPCEWFHDWLAQVSRVQNGV